MQVCRFHIGAENGKQRQRSRRGTKQRAHQRQHRWREGGGSGWAGSGAWRGRPPAEDKKRNCAQSPMYVCQA